MLFRNLDEQFKFFESCQDDSCSTHVQLLGMSMCNLLSQIHKVQTDAVWNLSTSHFTLYFSMDSIAPVSVEPLPWGNPIIPDVRNELTGTFCIQYDMKREIEPWPNSKVKIEAKNVSEALAILKIAFRECKSEGK